MLATAQNHDPRAAIQRMKAAGFTLKLRNDKLVVIPASQLSPEQRAFIRANKAALVAALVQPTPAENLANLVFKPRKDTALMPFLLNSLASLSPAPTGTPPSTARGRRNTAPYPPHPRGHPPFLLWRRRKILRPGDEPAKNTVTYFWRFPTFPFSS